MKAIIGTDGSSCAQVAIQLAASLPWPEGTQLRVVAALDPMAFYGPFVGFAPGVGETEQGLRTELQGFTAAAAAKLARPGLQVDYRVLMGRPSTVLHTEAQEFGADLIVVGSRGHGRVANMLLGSVSAEVVDHAPCPVLVARKADLERVVLAHDGSETAFAAESVLRTWPIFGGAQVDVVSVADSAQGWDVMLAAEVGIPTEQMGAVQNASRRQHEVIAERSAHRLTAEGHASETVVPYGDPAHLLLTVAGQHGANLIVMGTRGNTGLKRLLLGSVARNVLTHAHCSVLVVPPSESAVSALA
jgi:nucleotide-binding universal stress UspA family protein